MLNKRLRHNERMKMTATDELDFGTGNTCHICNEYISKNNYNVRDHDHRTGNDRGAAHLNI